MSDTEISSLRDLLAEYVTLLERTLQGMSFNEQMAKAERLLPRTRIELARQQEILRRKRAMPTTRERTPRVRAMARATGYSLSTVRARHADEFHDECFGPRLKAWAEEHGDGHRPHSDTRDYKNIYREALLELVNRYPIERAQAYDAYMKTWNEENPDA